MAVRPRRSQRCARHRWARSVLWERFSHGDGVCTVGRSFGKHVSLMGVLRPGTGKLQSGSAGLDLRKATCGPVPRSHKPYKVAGRRLSRRIYPPRANQMTSATATMARITATSARALHAGPRLTPE